ISTEAVRKMRKRIAEFLVERGSITGAQAKQVFERSQESGKGVCAAILELGVMDRAALIAAFAPGFAGSVLDSLPQRIPDSTRALLSAKHALKFGAIPFGIQVESATIPGRDLNILEVALLSPPKSEIVHRIEWLVRNRAGGLAIDEIRVRIVMPDAFLDALERFHGLRELEIRLRHPEEVEPALRALVCGPDSPSEKRLAAEALPSNKPTT
ncbi:MAG TPA: hypothetical protein VM598_08090, partial [Bdellovibrionota bacterium]|nr:hypothetical protein [Bdellovibrionota bacterium]